MEKKKYVSFSLWGDKPIYTIGAIKNAELMSLIYPDFNMIVYHDETVPFEILNNLIERGVELVFVEEKSIHPLFWRFFVADRQDCERAIFRDSDSRISKRESEAVNEWIVQNKVLHVMRDHPFHEIPFGTHKLGILGGMWGIKGECVAMKEMIKSFVEFQKDQQYGIDQSFLESIYNEFQNSKTIHDEFFEKIKFPIKREKYRFVGERIDENNNPFGDDWIHIKNHERKSKKGLKGLLRRIFK